MKQILSLDTGKIGVLVACKLSVMGDYRLSVGDSNDAVQLFVLEKNLRFRIHHSVNYLR
jgi:hypothetical protein